MHLVHGWLAFDGLAASLEPICNVIMMPLHDKLWERLRARLDREQRASKPARAA